MTIKEVGKKFGLSGSTLRYYEKAGLLPEVRRNPGGLRDYTEADCDRIQFVKTMRSAGVPIEVLTEYFSLCSQGKPGSKAQKTLLKTQRAQLARHIVEMQAAITAIDQLTVSN